METNKENNAQSESHGTVIVYDNNTSEFSDRQNSLIVIDLADIDQTINSTLEEQHDFWPEIGENFKMRV